ncbi:MAG: hypothetical protein H6733_10185 [Alphaproteobacteria bacterium]|nr:hypothetical protein [Alphaproteobacteria bacterium]
MAFALSDIADLRVSAVASAEYLRLLADRSALPNHPALLYAGNAAGSGSASIQIGHLGIDGYDLLASTGDGSAVSATTPTDGKTTVTVARYSKAYSPTDLARLTDHQGLISPERFAVDAYQSGASTLVNLVAALGSGFSGTVGVSGSDLDAATFLAAKASLEIANVEGPYLAILHPRQFADLRADIVTSAGGSIPFDPASPAMLRVMGQGYVGSWAGVDIFVTSRVPTANAGADRAGCMIGRGAVCWADASVVVDDPASQVVLGNKVLFERDRQALSGLTHWVSHYYVGVAEGIDAAGIGIVTDA